MSGSLYLTRSFVVSNIHAVYEILGKLFLLLPAKRKIFLQINGVRFLGIWFCLYFNRLRNTQCSLMLQMVMKLAFKRTRYHCLVTVTGINFPLRLCLVASNLNWALG